MPRCSIALALLVLAVGCNDNTPVCVPDPDPALADMKECTCETGELGYRLCESDGLGFGECICGSPPTSGNGGIGGAADASGE